MKLLYQKHFSKLIIYPFLFGYVLYAQTHLPADPFYLLLNEKSQFEDRGSIQFNLFRPVFFNTDSASFSFMLRSEGYYNDNAPNQENMDVRYFSKGMGIFNSFQVAFNSPYFSFMFEPYILQNKSYPVDNVSRDGAFIPLNDRVLSNKIRQIETNLRNLLVFVHFKGIGIGWQSGNRWWGPGIHSTLSMTNNTVGIPATTIGTIQELKWGTFGFFGQYTFAKMNRASGWRAKYFTALNGGITWYGPIEITAGFSRNYLTGGADIGVSWTEKDAKNIIFEGIFIKNLIKEEYTVGGHDPWDQTISSYLSLNFPKEKMKVYTEIGWNDNRLHFADFFSQPDHAMATIIGFRKYGLGNDYPNILMGAEWANLMVSFSSRYRATPPWYERSLYEHSSYKGRRWGAHSGADSDDWYIYAGYLSDKIMFIPAINYERHGIVSNRPAEVKFELRIDTRYKYNNIWFGLYYEKQYEAFLGFPQHYYVDEQGNPTTDWEGEMANNRKTNTIIISISKSINY